MRNILINQFQKKYNDVVDFILGKKRPTLDEKQENNLNILDRKCRALEHEIENILSESMGNIFSTKYVIRVEELNETEREYEILKTNYEKEKVTEAVEKLYNVSEQIRDVLNLEERIILTNELLKLTIEVKNEYIENRRKLPITFENNNDEFINYNELSPTFLQTSIMLYSAQIKNLDINYCTNELIDILSKNNKLFITVMIIEQVKQIIEGKAKTNSSDKQDFPKKK